MHYHTISLIGARQKNEDEIEININMDGINPNQKKINFFGVFDGHGGDKISKYLKEKLPKFFINKAIEFDPSKSKSYNKYINKIYEYIQNKLVNFELPSKTCGSTALIVLNYPKCNIYSQLKIINLGDCRAVLCNEHNIGIPLTKDHKPMSYDENHRILNAGGKIITDLGDDPRINGLSVSRAFGDLDSKPHVSHMPDIYDYEINLEKDKFLIMGCDGVWDVLSNQDAVDFVLYSMDEIKISSNCSTRSLKNIANLLGDYAIKKGSQDNISVLIVWF
jgi:serine/threonine protein phosphatase PrpC